MLKESCNDINDDIVRLLSFMIIVYYKKNKIMFLLLFISLSSLFIYFLQSFIFQTLHSIVSLLCDLTYTDMKISFIIFFYKIHHIV